VLAVRRPRRAARVVSPEEHAPVRHRCASPPRRTTAAR
jgi:hypothetical protein